MTNLELSQNDLNKLFPFIIILSKDLEIKYTGKSISKLYPKLHKKTNFFDNFKIITKLEGVKNELMKIKNQL